jgi:hypothetical protein
MRSITPTDKETRLQKHSNSRIQWFPQQDLPSFVPVESDEQQAIFPRVDDFIFEEHSDFFATVGAGFFDPSCACCANATPAMTRTRTTAIALICFISVDSF